MKSLILLVVVAVFVMVPAAKADLPDPQAPCNQGTITGYSIGYGGPLAGAVGYTPASTDLHQEAIAVHDELQTNLIDCEARPPISSDAADPSGVDQPPPGLIDE